MKKVASVTSATALSIGLGFLVWRLALLVVSWLAPQLLEYRPSFPYYEVLLPKYGLPQALYSWANFDGAHYLTIAEKGYQGTGLIQAFFPVYPILVGVLSTVTTQTLLMGLLVSNLAAIVMGVMWSGFVRELYSAKIAWLSLAFLFLFPTAFYWGAMYGESLFMVFVIGAFWSASKKQWWLAGLWAALASASRVVGVLVVPALVIELLWQKYLSLSPKEKNLDWWKIAQKSIIDTLRDEWSALAGISVGVIGLLAYMAYLYLYFHDPLYFVHVQSEFGAGRQESLIPYPQVVWRYLKILATYRPIDLKYFAYVQEAMVGVVGLLALLFSLKSVRPSLVFFSVAAFLVPTLTGTFSSMPRYILVSLALYIWLAQLLAERPRWCIIYVVTSVALLILNTVLFIQGYWVA